MLLQQHLEMVKGAELTTLEAFLTCLSSAHPEALMKAQLGAPSCLILQ